MAPDRRRISIGRRLRPIRLAFLVQPGDFEDAQACVRDQQLPVGRTRQRCDPGVSAHAALVGSVAGRARGHVGAHETVSAFSTDSIARSAFFLTS